MPSLLLHLIDFPLLQGVDWVLVVFNFLDDPIPFEVVLLEHLLLGVLVLLDFEHFVGETVEQLFGQQLLNGLQQVVGGVLFFVSSIVRTRALVLSAGMSSGLSLVGPGNVRIFGVVFARPVLVFGVAHVRTVLDPTVSPF